MVDETKEVRDALAIFEKIGDGGAFVSCYRVKDSSRVVVVGAEEEEVEEGFAYAVLAMRAIGRVCSFDAK